MRKVKMSFEKFCELLIDRLNSEGKVKYLIKDVLKANDHKKKAISAIENCKVSPMIYVDALYDRLDYESFDSIVTSVMDMLSTGMDALDNSDVCEKLTHDGIKDSLTFRLINKEMNALYLENKVFREYLDLAIIYQVQVSVGDDNGVVVITTDLAKSLKYSEEQLFQMAINNTPRLFPAQDIGFKEMLGTLLPDSDGIGMPECFRVLTNMNKVFGASVLLYPGMIEKLYREYGCRYVIPSSLHEVLIVDHNVDPKNYLQMVRQVNSTVVEAEDILSNSVYEITGDGLLIAATAA